MTYAQDIALILGQANSGLTDLRARLFDSTGANVGSAISTGFAEIGNGNYIWHYAAFPSGHRGGVKFYSNAAPSTILAIAEINPETAENTDVKTSSISTIDSTGLYTITMTVRDSETLQPLPHVLVVIKDATDTTILDTGRTSAAGINAPSLDAATYKVHIGSVPGYSSLTATLVVSANGSVTYDIDPLSIGIPATPDMCRVYGYQYQDGNPVENRTVKCTLIRLPETSGTTILEGVEQTTTTDSNGYWYFDLVIAKVYRIEIEEASVSVRLLVPDQSTLDFSTEVVP